MCNLMSTFTKDSNFAEILQDLVAEQVAEHAGSFRQQLWVEQD